MRQEASFLVHFVRENEMQSVGQMPAWRRVGFKNLALLELFPILVAVVVWGKIFRNRKVCFHLDNLSMVMAFNRLSVSLPPVVK